MNKEQILALLQTVMDPELNVDIVSLGLIYDVSVSTIQTPTGPRPRIHVLMTLTTPGCPLASSFQFMIRDVLKKIPGINLDQDVEVELTFDPPWTIDMMSKETRMNLGLE